MPAFVDLILRTPTREPLPFRGMLGGQTDFSFAIFFDRV